MVMSVSARAITAPAPIKRLGRGDKSSEPDFDGCDFDEADEIVEKFVVSCGDASELFELVEEPFDDVALFVERLVAGVLMLAMTPWRDDGLGAGIEDGVHQAIGVIGAIGEHGVGLEAFDQVERFGHVVFLARPGQEAAGVA